MTPVLATQDMPQNYLKRLRLQLTKNKYIMMTYASLTENVFRNELRRNNEIYQDKARVSCQYD